MTHRSGAISLVELVVVLMLLPPLLLSAAALARVQSRAAAHQRAALRAAEAARTVQVILHGELRHALPLQLVSLEPQRLRIRAARGSGRVCHADGNSVVVAYTGARLPEADKDSVLLITGSGHGAADVLLVEPSGACPGGIRLKIEPGPPAGAAMALVYEPGDYWLADGAFRYRLGAAGRQPLTESVLGSQSRFSPSPGGLLATLAFDPDSVRPARPRSTGAWIRMLNGGVP